MLPHDRLDVNTHDRLVFTLLLLLITGGLILLMVSAGRPSPSTSPVATRREPPRSAEDTAVVVDLDANGQVVVP